MDYQLHRILPGETAAQQQLVALLHQQNIRLDPHLEYTVGLYDGPRLAATGSFFGNTLRCLAVGQDYQGLGLLNTVVSHLVSELAQRQIFHLFVYTKGKNLPFFRDLGFYEICRLEDSLVFLENRKGGFERYLSRLERETPPPASPACGAVVMNANPFTNGHRYLVEQAAADCQTLHLFVVSEDRSAIPFPVRYRLVQEGVSGIPHVVLHQTESYLISSATFPSYFLRDSDEAIRMQAALDVEVFCRIAHRLRITRRFVGEEPFSHVTGIYNDVMAQRLRPTGIALTILPRLAQGDRPISASAVRRLLAAEDFPALEQLVPPSTLAFFRSPEGAKIIEQLRQLGDTTHY